MRPSSVLLRLVAVASRRRNGHARRAGDSQPVTDFTEPRFDHAPRPMAQRVGAILWQSFFAAGVATMVFFAFVDPPMLRDMTFPPLPMTRGVGYSSEERRVGKECVCKGSSR